MDQGTIAVLIMVLLLSIPSFLISYIFFRRKLTKLKDIAKAEIRDEVVKQAEKDLLKIKSDIAKQEKELHRVIDEINVQKEKLKRLMHEVMKYEDVLEMQEVGIYRPFFDFDTPEEYKIKIDSLREKQKQMIKDGVACTCGTEWTINGSATKGKAMINESIKFALRAFNNECDAVINNVNHKNINRALERILKSYEYTNKLNSKNDIALSLDYMELKREELKATYEYAVKKEQEREEQRLIKEQMREEARVQRELEQARIEAEKARREYEKELENTRRLLEKDEQNAALQEKLLSLESELKQAIDRGQRALSQAQLTRSGHVYIVSNIGSFGDDVYKIGMTRRLEPLDRIRELGDASVPFSFDVHAMIYSDDAPALEYELHKKFADKQVNRVNPRKEFFKVSLAEISDAVREFNSEIEITMLAEAREYRESIELEKQNIAANPEMSQDEDIDDYIDKI